MELTWDEVNERFVVWELGGLAWDALALAILCPFICGSK